MVISLGKLVQQKSRQWGAYKAFVPNMFPPSKGFSLDSSMIKKDSQAQHHVSTLNGIIRLLPDKDFFLFMYILKDAASSSQIEGTGATMIDALEAEAKIGVDLPEDVDDITHYIKALNSGIKSLEKTPISVRLLKSIHKEFDGRRTIYPGCASR